MYSLFLTLAFSLSVYVFTLPHSGFLYSLFLTLAFSLSLSRSGSRSGSLSGCLSLALSSRRKKITVKKRGWEIMADPDTLCKETKLKNKFKKGSEILAELWVGGLALASPTNIP
jgi:hypothetical protein